MTTTSASAVDHVDDVMECRPLRLGTTEAEVRGAGPVGGVDHGRRARQERIVKIAGDAAGELYAYGHHDVLFADEGGGLPVPATAAEAMSYFVGGARRRLRGVCFVINGGKGFKEVVENYAIDLNGSLALAMGNYRFTCATTGEESKVEYTFGYKRCGDGWHLPPLVAPYQRQTGKQRRAVAGRRRHLADRIDQGRPRSDESFREGVIIDLNDFKFDDAPPAAKAPAVA